MSSSSSTPSLPKPQIPCKEEVKEEVVAATKSTLSGLRSLAAGGVGGVCAVVVGHPFDLVKVRLQTAEKGVYSGAIDVVKRTVAREGLARVSGADTGRTVGAGSQS
jgi:solute carrier family 25 carnitine/acylcarnitine transporter 20/29